MKELIEKVAHDRKLFGGGLLSAWPYTAVALHYLAGFAARFRAVVAHASAFFEALGRLLARACRIAEEVLVLLKAGYGQGALARKE